MASALTKVITGKINLILDLSHVDLESKTLQGVKDELSLDETRQYVLENTTVDFQQLLDKAVLRITGPLGADFIVKVRLGLISRPTPNLFIQR